MLKGLRHAGLVVQDIDKALYFYKDLLCFSIFKDAHETGPFIEHLVGIPNVKVRTVKMRGINEGLLELLYFDEGFFSSGGGRKLTEQGFTHIAVTVEDIDLFYQRLKKARVSFIAPPKVSDDGKAKVAFCRDFEGNYIELVEEMT